MYVKMFATCQMIISNIENLTDHIKCWFIEYETNSQLRRPNKIESSWEYKRNCVYMNTRYPAAKLQHLIWKLITHKKHKTNHMCSFTLKLYEHIFITFSLEWCISLFLPLAHSIFNFFFEFLFIFVFRLVFATRDLFNCLEIDILFLEFLIKM